MPLTEPEWNSIAQFTEKIVKQVIGTRGDFFVTGKVVKVDAANKCVYLAEFGDQAVPLVGFDYALTYYDEGADGKTNKKMATISPAVPKVGQSVLVAREMGTSRLPRALGVIQGKKWIVSEEE